MKNKKNIAMYARVGNYEQLESPIDIILDQARRGEIQTVLVSSLERLCEDRVRREALIKELSDCGVKIITSFTEKTKERCCAIYNRYSTDDFERLAEVRGKLITYCTETLGVTDYVLFEEVGSVLEKREVFDDMMVRIKTGEFTDLLVNHIDRIFKPVYDLEAFAKIVGEISSKVNIHSVNH